MTIFEEIESIAKSIDKDGLTNVIISDNGDNAEIRYTLKDNSLCIIQWIPYNLFNHTMAKSLLEKKYRMLIDNLT